jgi:2-haloacid dehalogenase
VTVPLTGIRACVFDAYGTLFDYASAASRCRDAVGDRFAALTTLWRDKQLHYSWLRAVQDRHADFWQVTGDALDYALEALDIADPALRQRLLDLYLTLDVFPDVPDMLARLKQAGLQTAILSNGAPAMLRAAVEAARIGPLLDAVLSVEEVGVFKPHPKVYQLSVERLGVAASAICFVSSNGWDAYAASAFGMRVAWCNREGPARRASSRQTGPRDHIFGRSARPRRRLTASCTALYSVSMTRTIQYKGAEEARNQLPSLLDEAEQGRSTIITRHGRAVAALVPADAYAPASRQQPLLPMAGSGRGLWGKDSARTLRKLREEWRR